MWKSIINIKFTHHAIRVLFYESVGVSKRNSIQNKEEYLNYTFIFLENKLTIV